MVLTDSVGSVHARGPATTIILANVPAAMHVDHVQDLGAPLAEVCKREAHEGNTEKSKARNGRFKRHNRIGKSVSSGDGDKDKKVTEIDKRRGHEDETG
jgi:hypothetical protein